MVAATVTVAKVGVEVTVGVVIRVEEVVVVAAAVVRGAVPVAVASAVAVVAVVAVGAAVAVVAGGPNRSILVLPRTIHFASFCFSVASHSTMFSACSGPAERHPAIPALPEVIK